MPRKEAAIVIAVTTLAIMGGLLTFWLLTPKRQLNVDGFTELRPAMTVAEVEHLMGGPPGNYGWHSDKNCVMGMEPTVCDLTPPSARRVWCDDNNRFEICFDADGRLVGKHKRSGYRQEPGWSSAWQFLRRTLGL